MAHAVSMGKSCKELSWIQDFKADFQWNVSLRILNWADYDALYLLWFMFGLINLIWPFNLNSTEGKGYPISSEVQRQSVCIASPRPLGGFSKKIVLDPINQVKSTQILMT